MAAHPRRVNKPKTTACFISHLLSISRPEKGWGKSNALTLRTLDWLKVAKYFFLQIFRGETAPRCRKDTVGRMKTQSIDALHLTASHSLRGIGGDSRFARFL